MLTVRRAAVLFAVAVISVGCSSSSASTSPAAAATPLTVFAASSLTKAFTQIGQDFHTANPDVTVTFNFGSSTDPCVADPERRHRRRVRLGERHRDGHPPERSGGDGPNGLRDEPARDHHAPGQPGGDHFHERSGEIGVKLVLAAEGVPVGDYARESLEERRHPRAGDGERGL